MVDASRQPPPSRGLGDPSLLARRRDLFNIATGVGRVSQQMDSTWIVANKWPAAAHDLSTFQPQSSRGLGDPSLLARRRDLFNIATGVGLVSQQIDSTWIVANKWLAAAHDLPTFQPQSSPIVFSRQPLFNALALWTRSVCARGSRALPKHRTSRINDLFRHGPSLANAAGTGCSLTELLDTGDRSDTFLSLC
ncbi:hypothetical protein PCH_Pc20g05200 [Penicillium rubens Wisconsin 54-1255]|uniref:Uncharacterized protein n=1 Tax=Penicillium rubens (strain ATCC 28089 / DSM 1075 / NRRL 1951 / Wisconsin 54-1255) TaxID=500485 RepID=B6HEG0_PENRW|nr:hypothetical protein PCH_Pc20g05200 [Penicillium rubens Wisconsin 54-1255]